MEFEGVQYYFQKNLQNDIVRIVNQEGNLVATYQYDAWGNHKVMNPDGSENKDEGFIGNRNPFRYRSYYYDGDTDLYYLNTRYYDPEMGRFINSDDISYLDPDTLNGLNLYAYCGNNPVMHIKRGASSGSSLNNYSAFSVGNSDGGIKGSGLGSQSLHFSPEWLKIGVGAIPDIILGVRYLLAKGIHNKFVYSSKEFYMFPELGANWHKFKIPNYGYGDLVGASFKQIVTGNARAGFGLIAKTFGKTAALTGFINFGFNLYENNGQIDGTMLIDTAIDTGIGLAAYGLAAGTASFALAGLAMAGLAIPGGVVVVGIIGLSIFFDWAIREITGYKY